MLLQTYIYIVPFDVFTKIKHPFLVPWKNVLLASPRKCFLFFVEDPMRKEVSSGRCAVPQQDTEEEVEEGNKV